MNTSIHRPPPTDFKHTIKHHDDAWLLKWQEDVIEPELPIVDAHHHLWDWTPPYLFNELLVDINSGHNIRSTVYVNCWSMYRAEGPIEFRPVGEIEFANGIAAMSATGNYGPARVCAGIIGFADLRLADAVIPVLEAEIHVGGGRLRGIRAMSAWDPDPAISTPPSRSTRGLLQHPDFRAGFRHLARFGLIFEAWAFHHQLPEVLDLAQAFPETLIVLNHGGGVLARGAYAAKTEEVYALWLANMRDLARCPNVVVKLGGMGHRTPSIEDFAQLDMPPSSDMLAKLWKRYIEACIQEFGPDRCMFESNFPVDKTCYSYRVVWNAFKRITSRYSASEKAALFSGTAARVYRLQNA